MPQGKRGSEIDALAVEYSNQVLDQEADKQGVPREFARKIAGIESADRADVITGGRRSSAGAIGKMQLMPGTAKDLGVDPYNIDQNIAGGVKYLGQQLKSFGGDQRLAAAAYNAGPGNVRKYKGVPPFAETQKYASNFGGTGGGGESEIDKLAREFSGQPSQPAPKPARTQPLRAPNVTSPFSFDAPTGFQSAVQGASQAVGQIGQSADYDARAQAQASAPTGLINIAGRVGRGLTSLANAPAGIAKTLDVLTTPPDWAYPAGARKPVAGAPGPFEAAARPVTDPLARAQKAAAGAIPVNEMDNSFLTAKLPEAVGSGIGFMAGGGAGRVLGLGARAVPALLGAGTNVEGVSREFDQAGGDPAKRNRALLAAAATGSLEAFGVGGQAAKAANLGAQGLKQTARRIGKEGVEEGAQEYGSEYGGDINARLIGQYDKSKSLSPLSRNKLEAAALGGIVGGGFQGARSLAEKTVGREARLRATDSAEPLGPPSPVRTIQRVRPLNRTTTTPAPPPTEPLAPMLNVRRPNRRLAIPPERPPRTEALTEPLTEQLQPNAPATTAMPSVANAPETTQISQEAAPPVNPRNRMIIATKQNADAAAANYQKAFESGDYEGAERSLREQKRYLGDLKSVIGKAKTPGDSVQRARIDAEIGSVGNRLGEVRKARRGIISQENRPTSDLPVSNVAETTPMPRVTVPETRRVTSETDTPTREIESSSPLLNQIVNPEGGVPAIKPESVDFTQLAARQERGQDNPLANKSILARIRELGGIKPGQDSGELQGAKDKRYPGLINRLTEPRRVRINDQDVDLSPEQAARWDESAAKYQESRANIQRSLEQGIIDKQQAGERLRGLGMRESAERRQIAQSFTPKEQAAQSKREASNYRGKEVEVDGRKGVVAGMAFGKVRVKLDDGSVVSVDQDRIGAPPSRPPSAMEQARAELSADDQALIQRALSGEPAPGRARQGMVSFSPYADLVSNNRQAIDDLSRMNIDSPEARPLIDQLDSFAQNRKIDPEHVENLKNYLRNDQLERAGFERRGVNPDEALAPEPTANLRRFYSESDTLPPEASGRLSGRLPRIADTPAKPASTGTAKTATSESQPVINRPVNSIDDLAKMTPAEVDAALRDAEAKRNADIRNPQMSEADRRLNQEVLKAANDRRKEMVKAKELPAKFERQPSRAEKEANQWAEDPELRDEAQAFKEDNGRFPKDLAELRRGRPKTEPIATIQHERFGEVEVTGKAPNGKLVVEDADGQTHTIQNPRTKGNQQATFVKKPRTEELSIPVAEQMGKLSESAVGGSKTENAKITRGWERIEKRGEQEAKLTPVRRKANLDRFLEGSKVKEPIFHGTFSKEAIDQIDPDRFDKKLLYGPGFYMTTSADVATGEGGYGGRREVPDVASAKQDPQWASKVEEFEGYMPNRPKTEIEEMAALDLGYLAEEAGQGYKLYANIKNPFDADKTYSQKEALAILQGLDPDIKASAEMRGDEIYSKLSGKANKEEVNGYLKKAGFDGITHVGRDGRGGQVWIAFEPNQVKSAIGNVGTFNRSDPSITDARSKPKFVADAEARLRDTATGNQAEDADSTSYLAFDPEQIKSATGNKGAYDSSKTSVLQSISDASNVNTIKDSSSRIQKAFRLDDPKDSGKAPVLHIDPSFYERLEIFRGSLGIFFPSRAIAEVESRVRDQSSLSKEEADAFMAQVRKATEASKKKGIDGVALTKNDNWIGPNDEVIRHETFHMGQYTALRIAEGKAGIANDNVMNLHDPGWAKKNSFLEKVGQTKNGKIVGNGDINLLAAEMPAYIAGGQLRFFDGVTKQEAENYMFDYLDHIYEHRGKNAFEEIERVARLSSEAKGFFDAVRQKRSGRPIGGADRGVGESSNAEQGVLAPSGVGSKRSRSAKTNDAANEQDRQQRTAEIERIRARKDELEKKLLAMPLSWETPIDRQEALGRDLESLINEIDGLDRQLKDFEAENRTSSSIYKAIQPPTPVPAGLARQRAIAQARRAQSQTPVAKAGAVAPRPVAQQPAGAQAGPKPAAPRTAAPQTAQEYFDEQVKKSPFNVAGQRVKDLANEEARTALKKAADRVVRGKMNPNQEKAVISAADDLMMAGRLGDQDAIKKGREDLIRAMRNTDQQGAFTRGALAVARAPKQALRAAQSIVYGGDISFPLRQAAPMTLNPFNALRTWKAVKASYNAFGREEAGNKSLLPGSQGADAVRKQLESHKRYDLANQAGVELSVAGNQEEVYRDAGWSEKVPGLKTWMRRTQAANESFLDVMRLESFDKYATAIEKNTKLSAKQKELAMKSAADVINTMSGRTDLGEGKVKEAADALNGIFAAPRLLASRAKLLDPTAIAREWKKNPDVAKQMMKDAVGVVGPAMGLLTLAAAAGAKVGWNPEDEDFGKVVVDGTAVDFTAGLAPLMKVAYVWSKVGSAIAQEAADPSEENTKERQRAQREAWFRTGRFTRSKLGPAPSYLADLLWFGEDFEKSKVNLRSTINPMDPNFAPYRLAAPLGVTGAVKDAREEGSSAGRVAATTALEFFGASAYNKKARGEKLDRNSAFIEEAEAQGIDFRDLRPEKGEPDAVFKARTGKVNQWLSQYGPQLKNSPEYRAATAEQKERALRSLKARVMNEAKQKAPNMGNFNPSSIIRSIRQSERTRRRNRSDLIWAPPEED